jgi:hypothetical protein
MAGASYREWGKEAAVCGGDTIQQPCFRGLLSQAAPEKPLEAVDR